MTQHKMDGTEELVDYFREAPEVEVDHAISLYLEAGKKMPWRDTEMIRENGYKIQDIVAGDMQTKITLVRNTPADGCGPPPT